MTSLLWHSSARPWPQRRHPHGQISGTLGWKVNISYLQIEANCNRKWWDKRWVCSEWWAYTGEKVWCDQGGKNLKCPSEKICHWDHVWQPQVDLIMSISFPPSVLDGRGLPVTEVAGNGELPHSVSPSAGAVQTHRSVSEKVGGRWGALRGLRGLGGRGEGAHASHSNWLVNNSCYF